MTRRCTAMAKGTGQRCQRAPIPGGAVCRVHGGSAPQVKRKAEDRLRALVDPSIGALARAIDSDDVRASIVAAKDVLDRCAVDGIPQAPAPLSLSLATDEELETLYAIHERIARREAAIRPETPPDPRSSRLRLPTGSAGHPTPPVIIIEHPVTETIDAVAVAPLAEQTAETAPVTEPTIEAIEADEEVIEL